MSKSAIKFVILHYASFVLKAPFLPRSFPKSRDPFFLVNLLWQPKNRTLLNEQERVALSTASRRAVRTAASDNTMPILAWVAHAQLRRFVAAQACCADAVVDGFDFVFVACSAYAGCCSFDVGWAGARLALAAGAWGSCGSGSQGVWSIMSLEGEYTTLRNTSHRLGGVLGGVAVLKKQKNSSEENKKINFVSIQLALMFS